MVQFLSIIFFFLDFFNFCWVFQKFPFFVSLCIIYNIHISVFLKIPYFMSHTFFFPHKMSPKIALHQNINCMEQGTYWKANSFSASPEIRHFLWNVKVHCCLHKNSPLVPVLIQIITIHALPTDWLKIHFNIILPSTLRSSKCSLSFSFPSTKSCMYLSLHILRWT